MLQILDLTDFNVDGNVVIPFINKSTADATKISLIAYYVYNISTNKEWFVNFKHNDCTPAKICPEFTHSYILNLSDLNLDNNYDLELYYWWVTEEALQLPSMVAFDFYAKIYGHVDYRYIPIATLIDFSRDIKNKLLGLITDTTINFDNFMDFQKNCFNVFNKLNTQSINLDIYHPKIATMLRTDRIFSNYRLYTSTGRPSNSKSGINLAALNKSDGSRNMIVAEPESILMELDYSAFHIKLISKIINYPLPENPHEYFGKQYLNKEILDQDDYDLSKAISFKVVYGGIDEDYAIIPFFKKVYEFRKRLYEEYKINGFIRSIIFERPIGKGKNLPEHKLFNYLLQSYETEYNSIIIKRILNYLYNKNTKLILYTYDSFLFNLNKNDGVEVVDKLKDIIFEDNLSGSIKIGKKYGELNLI
jgi:hypothetical protein